MNACVEDGQLRPRCELLQDWGCAGDKVCCRSRIPSRAFVHFVNFATIQRIKMDKFQFGLFAVYVKMDKAPVAGC